MKENPGPIFKHFNAFCPVCNAYRMQGYAKWGGEAWRIQRTLWYTDFRTKSHKDFMVYLFQNKESQTDFMVYLFQNKESQRFYGIHISEQRVTDKDFMVYIFQNKESRTKTLWYTYFRTKNHRQRPK